MKTQGIYLSWIVVKDIKEAIKFYTEVAGLQLKEYYEEFGWAELAGPDGGKLGIAQESPQEVIKAGSNAVMSISVDNLEKARASFLEKGVNLVGDVIDVPGHVKMQTFTDSDGNTMQLVESY